MLSLLNRVSLWAVWLCPLPVFCATWISTEASGEWRTASNWEEGAAPDLT